MTSAEQDILKALVGRLIPASAEYNAPGADDDIIFNAIAADLAANAAALADLLGDLARDGRAAVAGRPLDQLLGYVGSAHPEAFGLIAVAVIQAYYRDDRVMRSLDLEPRPPFPKGHQIAEGDLSLLDPVRARGPIWREAP